MNGKARIRAAIAAAKQKQVSNVGLSIAQEQRLKARLRKVCPSEPWVEAQICDRLQTDSHGKPFVHRYHDPHVVPPGGTATAMVRCEQCRVWTPPHFFEGGICLDHSPHIGWSQSPSAQVFEALQFYRLKSKTEQLELEPESTSALREEIEQYHTKNRTPNANSACGNK